MCQVRFVCFFHYAFYFLRVLLRFLFCSHLRTCDIDSLCGTLTTLLNSVSIPLEALILNVVQPQLSRPRDRLKLQETFEQRFFTKVKILHAFLSSDADPDNS